MTEPRGGCRCPFSTRLNRSGKSARVAPDDADVVAFRAGETPFAVHERRQIRQNLIRQRRERDVIRNGEQIAHLSRVRTRTSGGRAAQQRADSASAVSASISGCSSANSSQLGFAGWPAAFAARGRRFPQTGAANQGLCQTVEHLVDEALGCWPRTVFRQGEEVAMLS